MTHELSNCILGQLELDATIAAPPARVWQALIEEIGKWWPKDFYALPDSAGMRLEPRVAGRVYEHSGSGAELLWFTVLALEPEKSLDLTGYLTPAFGGPALTMLLLELIPEGSTTILKISESLLGKVSEGGLQNMRDGWWLIFGEGLKGFVEGK